MTVAEWIGITIGVITISASFIGAVRWLVKGFLSELKPNSGASMKDQVNRLEEKVELLTELVKELIGR